MSRHSKKNMSKKHEYIELKNSENETLRSKKMNSKIQKKSKKIDLKNHSKYKKNDSKNSNMIQIKNLTEIKKTVNHKINEFR